MASSAASGGRAVARADEGVGDEGGRRDVPDAPGQVFRAGIGAVWGEGEEGGGGQRDLGSGTVDFPGRVIGADSDQLYPPPHERAAEDEAGQGAPGGGGGEDPYGRRARPAGWPVRSADLSPHLRRRAHVTEGAPGSGRAHGHDQCPPAPARDPARLLHHRGFAPPPAGHRHDAAPQESVQERITAPRIPGLAVDHQSAPEPQPSGRGRRHPAVVGVRPPRGHQVGHAPQPRWIQLVLELPHLVAAEPQSRPGVGLDRDVDIAAQGGGQPGRGEQGCREGRQRRAADRGQEGENGFG